MFVFRWPPVLALILLSSCGPAAREGVVAGFEMPDPNGFTASELNPSKAFGITLVETQSGVIDDTIAFVAGREEGAGLRAFAGVLPDQAIQPPVSGNAAFSGDYSVAFIDEIEITDNFVTGRNTLMNGTITLNADLSDQTLDGSDGVLSVTSRFDSAGAITGTVNVLGVSGELRGEVGDVRAFGAFHGADDTHLYSGGFVTSRDP